MKFQIHSTSHQAYQPKRTALGPVPKYVLWDGPTEFQECPECERENDITIYLTISL